MYTFWQGRQNKKKKKKKEKVIMRPEMIICPNGWVDLIQTCTPEP